MFKELGERLRGQIIAPAPSPRFDRFVEDLAAGKVPEIKNYGEQSEIAHLSTDREGNEIVALTNIVVGWEKRAYYITLKPTGERVVTPIPVFELYFD